jgi:hypothetical protein
MVEITLGSAIVQAKARRIAGTRFGLRVAHQQHETTAAQAFPECLLACVLGAQERRSAGQTGQGQQAAPPHRPSFPVHL